MLSENDEFMECLTINQVASQAASILSDGGILLYPTDTVWGIGCSADNTLGIEKISKLKGRTAGKPHIVLDHSFDRVRRYNPFLTEEMIMQIRSFSAPVTIVYPNYKGVDSAVRGDHDTVAVRVTKDELCRLMIQATGVPLISTSANYSGEPVPSQFSDIDSGIVDGVDWVLPYRQDEKNNLNPSLIYQLYLDGTLHRLR